MKRLRKEGYCMTECEQAVLLFRKACEDQMLVEEVLASSNVSDEIVGFHCQQAAEKFLKAVLSHVRVHFQRTHNLRQLMDLLHDAGHPLPKDLNDLDTLTPFGTAFRYDVLSETSSFDRPVAHETIRRLKTWAQQQLHGGG